MKNIHIEPRFRIRLLVNSILRNPYALALTAILYLLLPSLTYSQNVAFNWVKQVGSKEHLSNSHCAYSIATDRSGNVLTTGYYTGNKVDFDPSTNAADTFYLNAASEGTFISKLNKDGAMVWTKSVLAEEGFGIAVDQDDNIYVTGEFNGTVDFNPGPGIYNLTYLGFWKAAFILKLNAQGDFLWARKIEDANSFDIALDPGGNCYVTGTINASSFVAKYSASGNQVLYKEFGSGVMGAGAMAQDIAIDASGNMLLTGRYAGIVDFDPGPAVFNMTTVDANYIFVLKLDAAGNFNWVKGMGSQNFPGYVTINTGWSINTDADNNVLVTGKFYQTVDFNPGNIPAMPLTAIYTNDGASFIMKLKSTGTVAWVRKIDRAFGYAIDADPSGSVYSAGVFTGTTDFDPGAGSEIRTPWNSSDVYLSKLDSSGAFIWSKQMGGTRADVARAMVLDKSRNIYTTGFFSGTADYNPDADTFLLTTDTPGTTGLYNIFIHKLGCTDTSSSVHNITSCNESYTFNGVVYNSSGTYRQVVSNAAGCDSTIILNLTIAPLPQPLITINVFTLGTVGTYNTYQWILNTVPIPGATGSTYTVSQNGDYQVAVSGGGNCRDTSAIYTVTNTTGLHDVSNLAEKTSVFPNPARDVVFVICPFKATLILTDIEGRLLSQKQDTTSVSLKDLTPGIYLLKILDHEGRLIKAQKVVKQ